MGIGFRELLVILVVVLIIFGTKRLRSVGGDLGAAIKGFKKAMNEGENEEKTPENADNSLDKKQDDQA